MRVALLSDYETAGGAAIAASRLAGGLMGAGHEVVRLVNSSDGRRHDWKICKLSATVQNSLSRRVAAAS